MLNIGVDLGGTTIKVGVITGDGEIIAHRACATRPERGSEEIVREIVEICQELCSQQNLPIDQIHSIGFGTPGFIDRKNASVIFSSNLNFWDVHIRDRFYAYFPYPHIPVYVENDANCAAIAESEFGAAKSYNHSVTITLGTGVGAGVILNRRIFIGHKNLAPEIGHMVIEVDGEPCPCGRRGCLEQYVSASALKGQTARAVQEHPDSLLAKLATEHGEKISAKTAFEAARQSDPAAQELVARYLHYLAICLSNIIYCYGPEIIVLGGGVCNEGTTGLLYPLKERLDAVLMSSSLNKVTLELARFKNDAGVIGSAMLYRMQ